MASHLGEYQFSMRKGYGLVVFWFLFFGFPNIFLLSSWLDGNTDALLFALLLWSPAFYLLADRIRSRVHVYSQGLVHQSLFTRKAIKFTPALKMYIRRIHETVYGVNAARHVSVRLVQNKVEMKIPSSFLHMEEMVQVLLDYQQAFMLPAMVQAFNEGKTLNFGAVKLNRNMIAVNNKKFPFDLLRSIEIENGVLRVYSYTDSGGLFQKGAMSAELSQIANFDILNYLMTPPEDGVKVY